MQFIARPIVGIALFVAVTPFLYTRRDAPRALISTTAINQLHGETLVTVRVTTAAPVQDTRPMALQRATQLDGMLRAAPSQRMVIAANPFEKVWRAPSIGGVNLATGTYSIQDIDIELPAEGFSFSVARTYNARQETSGGAHRNSDGVQGANWGAASQPTIALYDDATDQEDSIYAMLGADRFAEYKRVYDPLLGVGSTYKGVNGAAGVFLYAAGAGSEPDTFTLTDQNGNQQVFFGFDSDAGAAPGRLWKITDTDGNVAYVGNSSTASTAISSGYDGSGRMTTAYDPSGKKYTYTVGLTESRTALLR